MCLALPIQQKMAMDVSPADGHLKPIRFRTSWMPVNEGRFRTFWMPYKFVVPSCVHFFNFPLLCFCSFAQFIFLFVFVADLCYQYFVSEMLSFVEKCSTSKHPQHVCCLAFGKKWFAFATLLFVCAACAYQRRTAAISMGTVCEGESPHAPLEMGW